MRRLLLTLLVFATLACNVVTRVAPTAPPATPLPATAAPATAATATPEAPASPVATDTPRPSRTTRPTPTAIRVVTPNAGWVAIYQDVWEDVRARYVYPDFNGADWQGLYGLYLGRVRVAGDPEEFYAIMRALIEELADDHSVFLSPEEAREDDAASQGTLDYVGIGLLRDVQEDERTAVILLVFPGSPADHAGLRAHDSILAIDGVPVVDATGASYIEELRGPEGSTVTLTVRSVGGQPRDVPVVRARINAQLPVETRRLAGDVGYLMVPAFDDLTIGDRAVAALRELAEEGAPLQGLIVDLRLNYGGYDSVLEQMLGLFTEGTVGYFVDRSDRRPLIIEASDVGGSQDLPLVVLVGQSTHSFAEIFSGVLQSIDRARIAGVTTTGNVEVIWPHDYADGSRLWLAQETFQPLRSAGNWEDTGIVPDIRVAAEWDEFTAADDPVIAAALEALRVSASQLAT